VRSCHPICYSDLPHPEPPELLAASDSQGVHVSSADGHLIIEAPFKDKKLVDMRLLLHAIYW